MCMYVHMCVCMCVCVDVYVCVCMRVFMCAPLPGRSSEPSLTRPRRRQHYLQTVSLGELTLIAGELTLDGQPAHSLASPLHWRRAAQGDPVQYHLQSPRTKPPRV